MQKNISADQSAVLIPHTDDVLFRRIRAWLRDESHTAHLEARHNKAVAPLLKDLKAQKVLLLFAPVGQDARDISRSSHYRKTSEVSVIELYVQPGLTYGIHLREMNEAAVGFMAVEALDLYAEYELREKRPVRGPAPAPL